MRARIASTYGCGGRFYCVTAILISMISRKRQGRIVFFALLVTLIAFTPWGQFNDPDAFYHAHISARMLDHGPLMRFPWLDLTSFNDPFADHHYLFHLILGPAIAVFGEFTGAQAMAPLLAALAGFALWSALRSLRTDPERAMDHSAWIVLALTFLVPQFTIRMLAAKASPLAVGLFIIMIGAMLFERPLMMAVAGMLFTLSHGGWIIGIAATGLMLVANVVASKTIDEHSLKESVKRAPWRTGLGLLAGIIIGIIVHPNRSTILPFLWIQVVEIGVKTQNTVIAQGLEWLPARPMDLIPALAPLLIGFIVLIAGLLFAGRGYEPSVQRTLSKRVVMLAAPVALTFALTLKSQRFIEYLAPSLALWLMSLLALVDMDRFKTWLIREYRAFNRPVRRILTVVLIAIAIALPVQQVRQAWSSLHRGVYPFDAYRSTFKAISERANPGDRVYHSQWDEFPILWATDDRLRYVSGLDPTFLSNANPELSSAMHDLTYGIVTSTAWEIIVERTGSKFVFVTTERYRVFDETLQRDERFTEIARDDRTAAYEIQTE